MAGGCCGGAPAGMERKWQFHQIGKSPVEFDTQAEAVAAQNAAGGKGHVRQVLRRKS